MAVGLPVKNAGETHSANEFNIMVTFVDGLETSIGTNTSNISTNTSNISTNTSNISSNGSAITTNGGNIATNAANISSNTSSISTNTSNISTNTGDIATNTSNIATNTSNISTNTSNISTNTSNLSAHTGDATIHRTINDSGTAATDLFSADKIFKHVGMEIIELDDDALDYVRATHSNKLIVCTTPTANHEIDIEDADVDIDDTFRILATTDSGFEYRVSASGTMTISDFEGNALASPYSLGDGMYLVHLDSTNDIIYVQKFGSGSGGTSGPMSFFEAYKSGTQAFTAGAGWGDVVFWTQGAGTDTAIFSFNATTGELTINATAPCLFVLDVGFNDTANNRVEGWIGLSEDQGGGHSLATRYTLPFYASRNTSIDNAGGAFAAVMDVTSGYKYKFQSKVEGANAQVLDDMARFYVVLLTGSVGPSGPAGGNLKADGSFRIQNTLDATKEMDFDVSGISTATKRTLTMPDYDVDLADIATNAADIAALNDYSPGSFSNATNGANWTGTTKSRKDDANIVQVIGEMTCGTPASLPIATLVAGHRPAAYTTRSIWNESTNTAIECFIQTDGDLDYNGGTISSGDIIRIDFSFEAS